ncbi:hypothetical protein, partial [Actibacterium sp.]|uniref:hypothetical protein n=1 Tax=Actibacterium sp. TaxID=1872125 RepID=UPI003569F767
VDGLIMAIGPRLRLAIKAVFTAAILVFLYLMATNGYIYASRLSAQSIPAIGFILEALTGTARSVSIFWVYVSVTAGSVVLALHIAGDFILDVVALATGTPRPMAGHLHGEL